MQENNSCTKQYFRAMVTGMRDEILSTVEAAERLGISKIRIRQLIDAGRLPAKKLGTAFAIRSTDLKLVEHRPPGRPKGKAKKAA
jgi:excisionase family DNA binding protein